MADNEYTEDTNDTDYMIIIYGDVCLAYEGGE